MPLSVRRRLISPILMTTNARGYITVPAGTIIETSDELDEPGLHSIKFRDEEFFVFTRDIEELTEPVDPPPKFPGND